MESLINHGTQAKFYQGNRDLFLRYFDSLEQYEALISAGNFRKMEEVIRLNSEFRIADSIKNQKK